MKDPSEFKVITKSPHVHRSLDESPIEEEEVVLLKDGNSTLHNSNSNIGRILKSYGGGEVEDIEECSLF